MRKIKFRLWDTEEKCFMNHSRVIESRVLALENNGEGRFIFQQWTGLLDGRGREIYEGDVVKGHYYAYGKARRFIGEVKFIGVAFKVVGVKQYRGMHQELDRLYETIGNIYENPELLEETK